MEILAPIIITLVTIFIFSQALSAVGKGAQRKKPLVSSDGHVVPKQQDITCENEFGHQHPKNKEYGRRYIVHEEPEEGYVVLNGIKRKITDCKYL